MGDDAGATRQFEADADPFLAARGFLSIRCMAPVPGPEPAGLRAEQKNEGHRRESTWKSQKNL